MNDTWTWLCDRCGRLLNHVDLVPRGRHYWHWDAVMKDWCGPVRKATVQ